MTNAARKQISHALLAEALSLDYDVLDLDEVSDLPTALPIGTGREKSRADIKELKGMLNRLVELGCKERVLYWCLERLDGTTVTMELASREDLVAVIKRVRSASKVIHKYRNELLIGADLLDTDYPIPREIFGDEPSTPVDLMLILKDLLGWVEHIAISWQKPNLKLLLKSKRILYLLIYVWMCTNSVASSASQKIRKQRNRKIKPDRIKRQEASIISHIANLHCEMNLTPEDLIDKLQDFYREYPDLYTKILELLETLEEAV